MQPPLEPGMRFGDFRIGTLLGRGKAGFVYSADDLIAHRRCALKVLCRMSSHDLYRNKLGFRRMSPFRHPCLLRTDRIEIVDDYTVLTMEEIEGQTLYSAALGLKDLPRAEAYRQLHSLLHDFAVGLAIMHFAGLVHRDLKPTNLMVRTNGHGVIVDYGLVANCDPETDPYGIRPYIAGTPRYFSPEALWEQSYTPAGDVFSLGLVMLDCLNQVSGCDGWLRGGEFNDWVRDEDEQTIAAAVSEMHEDIPPVLRMAVAGMLNADRTKRPSSLDIVTMTKTDDNPIRVITTHHLFGRQRELDQCTDWLREIYRGQTGRLHLYGEAGAGKTRLLDEIERLLRQNSWGQVFRVKCRSRENQTLQVLDQIADQIAQRYARTDREPLQLDPVSASILVQSFPQLRHVINVDLADHSASFAAAPERLDALAAAARLSRELRKVGPLVIIIDDAQWSDHDSDTVWDELQQDGDGYLGIITSSRRSETNQRQPAECRVHIGPLSPPSALAFLQTAATRWNANINQAGLQELVEVSRCNAFRLQELAEEFRPGGMLHRVEQSCDASISNLGDVDRFWRARFDRLSGEAKSILAFIVTAATPVSIAQLADLTDLGDKVDVSVSELVHQRLVNDDATGKECITVVHDKIADGLIENLDQIELHQAHLAWAALLSKLNRPRDFAARIAGHYYAAEQDGAALPFAIMAAENADSAFAKSEAGKWHARVLKQVTGDARDKHLRDAARCFHEADLPEQASHYYLELAELSQAPQEQLRFETLALQLLVRSGQMDRARPLFAELSGKLGIKIDDSVDQLTQGNRFQLPELAAELGGLDFTIHNTIEQSARTPSPTSIESDSDTPNDLIFCSEIIRPMAMLDMRSTTRLVLHGGQQALQQPATTHQVRFAALTNAWSAMLDSGQSDMIDRSLKALRGIQVQIANLPAGKQTADVSAGIAFAEAFAMRWSEVADAVNISVKDYLADARAMRFDIAHTQWLLLWADWHLGRWEPMRAMVQEMVEDANRRHDSYQQLLATTGYGGNAFLFSNNVDQLHQLCSQNNRIVTDSSDVELVDFFQWMQHVQQAVYVADDRNAARLVMRMRERIGNSLIRHIPLIQVTLDHFTTLVALHLRQHQTLQPGTRRGSDEAELMDSTIVDEATGRLKNQSCDFAKMLAALMQGVEKRIAGEPATAAAAFQKAAEMASDLGLFPFQLAAEDGLISSRQPDADADSLRQSMTNRRIHIPAQLERLYTVAPPQRPCQV
ncbi:AAA family ATPase [Stieleria sp. TO1_6]|uniref:protein kinase domain-containing protein n=1 Tax=Stieleria tagensis TaxID=2956795 RepID=UPI00209AE349|nr:AAA family ATPase [Stieleria tagensis]MCO8120281.1 AAA family ATPase [Stieleria tagensis]